MVGSPVHHCLVIFIGLSTASRTIDTRINGHRGVIKILQREAWTALELSALYILYTSFLLRELYESTLAEYGRSPSHIRRTILEIRMRKTGIFKHIASAIGINRGDTTDYWNGCNARSNIEDCHLTEVIVVFGRQHLSLPYQYLISPARCVGTIREWPSPSPTRSHGPPATEMHANGDRFPPGYVPDDGTPCPDP